VANKLHHIRDAGYNWLTHFF